MIQNPLAGSESLGTGIYFLKSLRIPGLVRCHSYHMFEIKSAREKQGRESAESAGDKYECGEIFECDKYMNIVKVKPGIGYLQRSWSSDSSNLLNLHL